MCLYFALMYKTLGGYKWSDLFSSTLDESECLATAEPSAVNSDDGSGFIEFEKDIFTSAKELQSSFQGLKAVSIDLH